MGTSRIRGAASLALGSLAVVALAASPTLANAAISTSDTTRHTMLAAELIGADASETADLESMIDLEDANDQLGDNQVGDNQVGDSQVDDLDANDGEHDQADQASTDQVDEVDGDNNQDESSTDANDDNSSESGSSGNGGGGD